MTLKKYEELTYSRKEEKTKQLMISILESYLLNEASVTGSGILATKILVTFLEGALISSCEKNKF